MSKFDREAIIAWAAEKAKEGTLSVTIWDQEVLVAESCRYKPEVALAKGLSDRFQRSLPDYSPNEARCCLAEAAWHGSGKGYVQMSLDELVTETLSEIADMRERGVTFAGDDVLEEDEEPDYRSLDELFTDTVDETE